MTTALLITAMAAQASGHEGEGITSDSSGFAHLGRLEIPGAMSIAFSAKTPQAYVSTRGNESTTLVVVDIANPREPMIVNSIALPDVGQEDLNIAERRDGTAFVLLGPLAASFTAQPLRVVDVSNVTTTNPPSVLATIPNVVSHTWTCVGRECWHAYGTSSLAGDETTPDLSTFAVLDLTIPSEPRFEEARPSSPIGPIHDWNYDEAGVMWSVGANGIAAHDVTIPTEPRPLNVSDENGNNGSSKYNDWAQLHGSLRPNAPKFRANIAAELASTSDGNVMLVTEEGNDHDCTDSFQTWHIPNLDGSLLPSPVTAGSGSITPLDSWSLLDDTVPGVDRPVDPDFCSVHWFDYHQDGFIVMATYGSGTRVLDVRNPSTIRQVAYHYGLADAAIQSYWVPERNDHGHMTGRVTNYVYTADAGSSYVTGLGHVAVIGGIDIFRWTGQK